MDKIDAITWNGYFDQMEGTVVHASERYLETVIRLQGRSIESGQVRAISTPGMVLTELSLNSVRPLLLVDSEPKESAESVFMLDGHVESRFTDRKESLQFGKRNHNFQYSTNFAGDHVIQPGHFHALTITYDLPFLNGLLQSNEGGSLDGLSKCLNKKENFLAAPQCASWGERISIIIHSLRQSNFNGATQYIFTESKMLELFVLQMESLHSQQNRAGGERWRSEDKDKLYAVKEYIERAYLEPLTLKQLTYEFGLNEFKLKKGYKHFFNTTVFGHILHLKMEKAKELLRERQLPVSEVAHLIGYNNPGSFSHEFKRRFGYSPASHLVC